MWLRTISVALAVALLAAGNAVFAGNWPQFRGPGGAGTAVGTDSLPLEIGPDKNVIWKTDLPPGHSSPIVWGERIFLTAVREQKLLTLGLDRATGKVLWEQVAPHEQLEQIHSIGSHAQCTPATDGERVVSFFGSSGLYCYDMDGKLLWERPMGPFKNDFGAGSSPIIVDDLVILCQDHDTDSFLAALDKRTGKTRWQTDRSEFPRNYGTPVVWEVGGKKQIVVAATLRVVGYDLESGKELWTVRGIARFISASPVVADGQLYVCGWAKGGDGNDALAIEPFDTVLPALDKNKNGLLERDELAKGDAVEQRYVQVDRDKSGTLTKEEYEFFRRLCSEGKNVLIAIKPGAEGEATQTHKVWEQKRHVPFCASPLIVDGTLFTVKDRGILSTLYAKDGKLAREGRLAAAADYYASPVSGDGKVFLLDQRGKLSIVSANPSWELLGKADFGEDAYGSPAIVDGRIYLRTNGHLYCFGLR